MSVKWQTKPLKDYCSDYKSGIVDGPFGSNLKKEHFTSEGVPVLKIQNIKISGINNKNLNYVSKDKAEELKRHSFNKLDIIMTKLGNPLGISAIVNDIEEGVIVADLVRIRADKIDTKFLCYQLNSPIIRNFINSKQKGATRPRVKLEVVRNLPISTPSLPEQKRIVAILDKAFEGIDTAIANTEKNLANARELFDSYLNQALLKIATGQIKQTLSCITELIIDCEHKTAPTQEKGFPSIRTPNIGKGKLVLDGVKRVSSETYEAWTKRGKPKSGDLILAREAPAGNVGVIPDGEKVCLGQRTVLIRPKPDINPKFLAFLMLHPCMQKRLLSSSTGATVQHVNMKDIRKLGLSELPSKILQDELANRIEESQNLADQVVKIYEHKLSSLSELKQSILNKAFSGELTTIKDDELRTEEVA